MKMSVMDLKEFQEGMTLPISKLSKKQLQEREEFWRALWSWIPDNVKYFVYRAGQIVRVYLRTYKGSLGELGEIKYEPSELELSVYEKHWDETRNKYFYEQKILKLPYSAVMYMEFIQDSEEAEQVEIPEVEGLANLVDEE